MKPTPEQIAAAKARARGAETEDQWVVLNKAGGGEVSDNACAILLAALEAAEERANIANRVLAAYSKVLDVLGAPAEGSDLQDLHEWAGALKTKLEAAEQDTARLDWLQAISHWQWPAFRKWDGKILLDDIGFPSECDRIAEGGSVRDALDAARKEART